MDNTGFRTNNGDDFSQNIGGESIEDLERKVFGEQLSYEAELERAKKELGELEITWKNIGLEDQGGLIKKVIQLSDMIGITSPEKRVNGAIKAYEGQYATLVSYERAVGKKAAGIEMRLQEEKQRIWEAGILMLRYEKQADAIRNLIEDKKSELEKASAAAVDNPEDIAYIQIQGDIAKLYSSLSANEAKTQSAAAKVGMYEQSVRSYKLVRARVGMLETMAREGKMRAEHRLNSIRIISENGELSAPEVLRVIGVCELEGKKLEAYLQKLTNNEIKAVEILKGMPHYDGGQTPNGSIDPIIEEDVLRRDSYVSQAKKVMEDLRTGKL